VVDESILLFVFAPFMGLLFKLLDESSNYEKRKSYQPLPASPLKGEEYFIIRVTQRSL
jgi:hypothetical protein